MGTTEVSACFEPEGQRLHVEVTVELNLYYEPADRSVGIPNESFSADGWDDVIHVQAWYSLTPDDENILRWESKTPYEASVAFAFITASQSAKWLKGLHNEIDDQCEEVARNFEPPEPDYEEYDKYEYDDR